MKVDTDESRRNSEPGRPSSGLALSPSVLELAGFGFQARGIKRVDIRDIGNYGLSVGVALLGER